MAKFKSSVSENNNSNTNGNNSNWDSDELALKNELKLIDDSYYRVYDDNDYEIWRERMMSMIANQSKALFIPSESIEDSSDSSKTETTVVESTISEINPIKPMILELPLEKIYNGLETRPANIENYSNNATLGLKYLFGEIDQKCHDKSRNNHFKGMILESKPGKSKWSNPNRIGQDELYQGLEKVLLDLKAYTPYSIPFLVKVSKKDVPDYYIVIKRPMDLGTMGKKLKAQEYNSKQQFVEDLNLIFTNCFTYNTAEDSIYRQHIQMLRDKWTYLLKSIPDIVVGKPLPESQKVQPPTSAQRSPPVPAKTTAEPIKSSPKSPTKSMPSSDPLGDDLDDLLNAHLDSLSDTESCPSPKKQRKSTLSETLIITRSYFNELCDRFPRRTDKLMIKYASDFKVAHSAKSRSDQEAQGSPFLFPELVYFFNTVPDSHLIQNCNVISRKSRNYSCIKTMNKFHDNFRILQSIRVLRKHLLEGSRAEVPSIEQFKPPSNRFDRFSGAFEEEIETSLQAKCILRKVITLYLAQAGFELISNSALHALFELVENLFKKLFDCLKSLTEEYRESKESADILRLALLQMDLKHISDLEVAMTEDSYAKSRLNSLLEAVVAKVEDYQLRIREESQMHYESTTAVVATTTQEGDCEDEDENDGEDVDEDEEDPDEGVSGKRRSRSRIDDDDEDDEHHNEDDEEEEEDSREDLEDETDDGEDDVNED